MENDLESSGIVLNALGKTHSLEISSEFLQQDSLQSVASLPILADSYEADVSLIKSLSKSRWFLYFIKSNACYWPESDKSDAICDRTWFIIARTIMIIATIGAIPLIVTAALSGESIQVMVWIATFFDFLSVIPGQYLNQIRLQERGGVLDVAVIDEGLRIATYFALTSALTVVFAMIAFGIYLRNWAVFVIALNMLTLAFELVLVMYLAFNLLFLVMDLEVSSLLLDQLDVLVDKQLLTLQRFSMVRDYIHRRDRDSQWATDLVVVPCAASALCIQILIYSVERGDGPYDAWSSVALIFMLLKHLFYVAIAFWYVAKVNGKADALTVKLSQQVWCPAESYVPDMQRLSIYASSAAEPIGYTLLFKRLNWQNVLVSAASFVVSFVVGVVKSIFHI